MAQETQSKEIERKFLINIKGFNMDLAGYSKEMIEQTYVSDEPEIRIRKSFILENLSETYYETIKSKGGLIRSEIEKPLTKEQYDILFKERITDVIKKDRYSIAFKGYIIQLDIYKDQLKGLIVAEIEFASEEQANAFKPPQWFGKEVTEDKKYKNYSLAKDGLLS